MMTFDSSTDLETAVEAWCTNATDAEATYGHISTWKCVAIISEPRLRSAPACALTVCASFAAHPRVP